MTNLATIVTDVEKGVEVVASDALKVLTGFKTKLTTLEGAEPAVVAALGTLLGATGTAIADVEAAAATPLNIVLDQATLAALKTVWPDVVKFVATLGIKL